MDKRKLRLILLGAVGVIILVIGIGAVHFYSDATYLSEMRDNFSNSLYYKDYHQLTDTQKQMVDGLIGNRRGPSISERSDQFREWLVKPLKWIGIGFGIFLILTAALVVSRVILNRIRPPSGPS